MPPQTVTTARGAQQFGATAIAIGELERVGTVTAARRAIREQFPSLPASEVNAVVSTAAARAERAGLSFEFRAASTIARPGQIAPDRYTVLVQWRDANGVYHQQYVSVTDDQGILSEDDVCTEAAYTIEEYSDTSPWAANAAVGIRGSASGALCHIVEHYVPG